MRTVLLKAWKRWLKLAEIIGNIQMIVFLTFIYWTMLFVIAVPFKLFSDDDYVAPKKLTPSFVKIDAKSSEYEILKRMEHTLQQLSRVFFRVETWCCISSTKDTRPMNSAAVGLSVIS